MTYIYWWDVNGKTIVNYITLNICIFLRYPIALLFFKTYSTTIEYDIMNYVVRHHVVSDRVSSQLVKPQIFPGHVFYSFGIYAPWSVNLPHQIGKQLTVPSLACYVCVPLVDSCSQSHHYHLLWPTKKMVGTLLLTWNHKLFGNGGLFLVAHISTWLLCLCTCFASVSACRSSRVSTEGSLCSCCWVVAEEMS